MVYRSFSLLVLFLSIGFSAMADGKILVDKSAGVKLVIDGAVLKKEEINGQDTATVYCITDQNICLVVTQRKSTFSKVDDYINCERPDLVKELKRITEDESCELINCIRSLYYPEESVVLHFKVSQGPAGLNGCYMYFFHHNDRDVQIEFIYNLTQASKSLSYINQVMKTFSFLDERGKKNK